LDLKRNKDQVASKHCVMRLFVICTCVLSTDVIKQRESCMYGRDKKWMLKFCLNCNVGYCVEGVGFDGRTILKIDLILFWINRILSTS
jgi:hypothetical protein